MWKIASYGPSLLFGTQMMCLGPEHSAHDIPGGRMANQIPVKTATIKSSSAVRHVIIICTASVKPGSSLNPQKAIRWPRSRRDLLGEFDTVEIKGDVSSDMSSFVSPNRRRLVLCMLTGQNCSGECSLECTSAIRTIGRERA
jgi:hypothetical protein